MTKDRALPIALGALGLALVVWIALFFFGGGDGEAPGAAIEPEAAPAAAAPPAPPEMKEVTLYFIGENDGLLHPETREIAASPSVEAEAEQVLAELLKGSRQGLAAPLPPETRIRQIFVTGDGIAYVDFAREIMEAFSYGSSSELTAVYAVVNTLTANLPAIKAVGLLVEGGEKETLGGHVDLSRPLLPQPAFIAK